MFSVLPRVLSNVGHLCGRFATARNGNVAITFGLAAIPLFGALAAALDFARMARSQSTLQSAMDASVLAGLAAASGREISTATNVFNANFNDPTATLGAPSFALDTSCGCLTGSVAGTVATSMMRVVGISTMPVSASAKASRKTTTKVQTVTLTATQAQGWYPKIVYVWTKDASGKVTALTDLVTYNFQFTPTQYGWTTPPLNSASTTLTLDPNYDTWGYMVRVYYGTAKGDQSKAGIQGPNYEMWSDSLPPAPVKFQGVTLQGDVKTSGTCDGAGGETVNVEDGGNSDYQDIVLTMKCTTGQGTAGGMPYLVN